MSYSLATLSEVSRWPAEGVMLCLDVSNSMGEDSGLKCGPPQIEKDETWDSEPPEEDTHEAKLAQLQDLQSSADFPIWAAIARDRGVDPVLPSPATHDGKARREAGETMLTAPFWSSEYSSFSVIHVC